MSIFLFYSETLALQGNPGVIVQHPQRETFYCYNARVEITDVKIAANKHCEIPHPHNDVDDNCFIAHVDQDSDLVYVRWARGAYEASCGINLELAQNMAQRHYESVQGKKPLIPGSTYGHRRIADHVVHWRVGSFLARSH